MISIKDIPTLLYCLAYAEALEVLSVEVTDTGRENLSKGCPEILACFLPMTGAPQPLS